MAWAFATVKQSPPKLVVALARAAEQRLIDINVQNVANPAWACLGCLHDPSPNYRSHLLKDQKLLAAPATEQRLRVAVFNTQAFQMAMWAFSQHEHSSETLWHVSPCKLL
eukprot:gnl/TRDRNA2_/TRDRNA2_172597_c6_seq4.p1 gnl/TRDRNA2_/TRDRNA2_172597_c6~~gnl/TRDRNA2_/TRDRNA2_172597_c6_seq4.p1  ORF type:complete len:110 (+),score=20.10 gnl/TRDRNA2_/TRDRNA2_172597_c6_seq4:222-551(+)